MTKPVTGQTTFGANTTGTTTQLDNNFLLAYNALNDLNTYGNFLTDTGSANAVVVTLAANLTGALTNGLTIQVRIAATNTGASTLNYNAGGALNILNLDGSALTGGQLPSGATVEFSYRSSDTSWLLLTPFGPPFSSSAPSITGRNRLINASFIVSQRIGAGPAVVADDNYSLDRWNVLTQNSNCNVSVQTAQENGTPQNIRLTQTGATASRLGLEQIVESVNCRDMRAANAVLSGRVRLSVAANVRYALVEWTGTADSPTSDIVNNWNDSTYAAGNFFIATTTTVTAVGVTALSANTWTTLTPVTGNVGASMTNLTAFLWTEANANQNVTLDIGWLQVEAGSAPTRFEVRNQTQDLAMCQRYFAKTFAQTTVPGDNTSSAGTIIGKGSNAGDAEPVAYWGFPVTMRAAPTVTLYTPGTGTTGQWGNPNAVSSNARGGAGLGASQAGTSIDNGGVAIGAGSQCYIQATAASEL